MSRFLAIDVELTKVHLVAGVAKGGTCKLDAAVTVHLSAPLSIATAKDLGKEFREALKASRITPAPLLVSLGREKVIVKDAKIPPVPPQEEAAVVRFQASKDLTEAADSVIIDYYPFAKLETDGQRRVVVVSVRKEYLEAYRQFATAAGVKLAGVTPRPIGALGALSRSIKSGEVTAPESAATSTAILLRGDKWGELLIAREDQVVFSRAVSAGTLTSETLMLGELKRNFAVANGQSPLSPVKSLYVVEASGPAGGWSGRIRAGFDFPVQAFDPLFGLDHDTTPETRGNFAGLVGLLQLKAEANPFAIDFLSPREPLPPSRRAQNIAAVIGFSILLLMLGGFAFGYYCVTLKEKEVVRLLKDKKDTETLLAELEVDRKRIDAVNDWDDKRINWLDELYDMADRFPDVKTTRLEQFRGEAREPEKGAKVKYVGRLVMKVQTSADGAFNNLQSIMNSDGKYHDIVPQTRGAGALGLGRGGANIKAYELKAELERRKNTEYVRKMTESPAKKPDKRSGLEAEQGPKSVGFPANGDGPPGGFPGFPGGFGGPNQ